MFIRIGKSSLKKNQENACGDCIITKRYKDSDKITAVLSDGLGSGIKANILSTMTSVMLMGFAENNADLVKSAEIVMNSLPVCKVRNISYSTFSVVVADNEGGVHIIEEGNPDFIYYSDNKIIELTPEIIDSKNHKDRHLKIYNLTLKENDVLVFVSDGVTQAGLASEQLRDGITRDGLKRIVKEYVEKTPNFNPDDLAHHITNIAKYVSSGHTPQDDISALVLRAARPKKALIYTGPPYNNDKDSEWASLFEEFDGKKGVAGGTTAGILARELNKEIYINQNSGGSLPAVSFMDGADIVTEGILTLTRVSEYLLDDNFEDKKDAAKDLIDFLLDADCIDFVVGAKVNSAHYDPNLPIEIELRRDVIKKIAKTLKDKYLKKVTVQYM